MRQGPSAQIIATRPSITDSKSGRWASSFQGPGKTTSVYGMRIFWPRERIAAAAPVNASAFTSGSRHRRTTRAKASATSGQP